MVSYEVEVPDRRGEIRVTCTEHGASETFSRSRRSVALHCPDCERELEITLHEEDWQELSEWC